MEVLGLESLVAVEEAPEVTELSKLLTKSSVDTSATVLIALASCY